MVVTHSKHDRS